MLRLYCLAVKVKLCGVGYQYINKFADGKVSFIRRCNEYFIVYFGGVPHRPADMRSVFISFDDCADSFPDASFVPFA